MLVGIAGGTGAGKTTVAEAIGDAAGTATTVVPMDNYYRDRSDIDPAERDDRNFDHPDAFDWELLRRHVTALQQGEAVEMPQWDFTRHTRTDDTVTVNPTGTVIVEGILALHDADLRDMYDLALYVMTDADVRILRRIRRDVEERGRDLASVIDRYLETVKPMHDRFVAPTKRHADVIIPEGHNETAVDLVAARLADT